MRFLVDQNANYQSVPLLNSFFLGHAFEHAATLGWGAVADVDLFERMSFLGYDAIVTRDQNQLRIPEERAALLHHSLHWIGFRVRKQRGVLGLALETATLLAGIPYVLDLVDGDPTAFHLKGVQGEVGQRVRVVPLRSAD